MFLDIENIDGDKKRLTKANENKELNVVIMDKIRELRSKAVCITKTMVIDIGKDVQQKILSENNCQFSNIWSRCFRNLYEFNRRKIVGEAYSNDFPAAIKFTEYFKVNCNNFDIHEFTMQMKLRFILSNRPINHML